MPRPQREHVGDVATVEGHLSVTDSRTGKSYQIQITDGAIRATDLRQIESQNGVGLISYDPAFLNTASGRVCLLRVRLASRG